MHWQSPFPALLQDQLFRIVDVNPAFVDLLGHPRDALIGRDPLEFQPREDHGSIRALRLQLAETVAGDMLPLQSEQHLLDASGSDRWVRASCRVLRDDAGQFFYLTQLQDTTAEHVARERADRSARELDDWFVLSPFGMVLYDETGLLVRTNPAFENLIGQLPVMLDEAPASLQHLLAWDDRASRAPEQRLDAAAAARRRAAGQPGLADAGRRQSAPSARHRALLPHLRRRAALHGGGRGSQRRGGTRSGAGADRRADGHRRRRTRHLPGVVGLGAPAGRAPPAAAPARPAAPISAALQSISRDIVLPESLGEYERLQHALRHAQPAEVRYAIRHPELGSRWLLTRVEPATLASGKRTTSVVTLDITEQQLTQARSEQLLREVSTILESSTAGIAYVRGAVLVRCNRRFEAMLGLRRGRVAGSSVHEIFALPAAGAARARRRDEGLVGRQALRDRDRDRARAPRRRRARASGSRCRCAAPARRPSSPR